MSELVIPEAHDHVRAATEAGVDRALSEEQAEGRVVRGRGHAPEGGAGAAALVQGRKVDPRRSITCIGGSEFAATRRYLAAGSRAQTVRWGVSLDMVGEDTEKTGGSFLIEKMPDPSAVWTRGDDHHTEWGGSPLRVDQLTPQGRVPSEHEMSRMI